MFQISQREDLHICKYADDTIIFLEQDDTTITNAKFLLYCFENLLGLKINNRKNEVFVLDATEEDQKRVAATFNSNIGKMPIKYLGIPVSDNHLTATDLMCVSQKVERRLPIWQCANLSYGEKAILIESCISSISNYRIEVYMLHDEIHRRMDTARANFFWHGPNLKKYHMARWQLLASPKESGGMGFTDTKTVSTCLLAKWIFTLREG